MIIKKVMFDNSHEALIIDGKFRSMIVQYLGVNSRYSNIVERLNDIYFMQDGVLYKATTRADFSDDLFIRGNIKEAFDGVMDKSGKIKYEECKSIRSAYRKMRSAGKRPMRTFTSIEAGDILLIHFVKLKLIEVQYVDTNADALEMLSCSSGEISYGMCGEMMIDGYPNLDDSSTCMNLMLTGARVDRMSEILKIFDDYTKNKDLNYVQTSELS